MVKNLPTMWETKVPSLGWEDSLEESMAAHSSTLAWGILRIVEPGGLQSIRLQRVGHDRSDFLCTHVLKQKQHHQLKKKFHELVQPPRFSALSR